MSWGWRGDESSLWSVVKSYSKILWKRNYKNFPARNAVVGLLRQALTEVCLQYLDADLFILDEFQRYRDLIKIQEESPAIQLAKKVFGIKGAKILMLSATPFKPYTTAVNLSAGEDHYSELKLVLEFLMQDKNETFWDQFEADRRAFFNFLRRPKEASSRLKEAMDTKHRLEDVYNDAIVRTERIMVSDDKNTMLASMAEAPFELELADIKDFIQTDKIVQGLNKILIKGKAHNPIEYAKSAPFPLSFMDRYKLKEHLSHHRGLKDIQKLLRDNAGCWIDFGKVNKYKPLMKDGPPNGKLRCLLEDTINCGGWMLLWVPPTISYYNFLGPYDGMDAFSKTLVFSSWGHWVPRMIATLVSYEAERRTVGNKRSVGRQESVSKNARTYFQKGKNKRRPRPQLVFTRDGKSKTVSNMSNFCILYPSPTLAAVYHPRLNLARQQSIAEIRKEVRKKIEALIQKQDLKRFEKQDGESSRWYWAAPIAAGQI